MKQLLYISNATRVMTNQDLRQLLVESRVLNEEHGITGVLFHIYGRFLQCIEGDDTAIDQLALNIRKDVRNRSFAVLSEGPIESRSFPDWSMGFRTFSVENFAKEAGFFRLDDEHYVETLRERNKEVIDLMKSIYNSV